MTYTNAEQENVIRNIKGSFDDIKAFLNDSDSVSQINIHIPSFETLLDTIFSNDNTGLKLWDIYKFLYCFEFFICSSVVKPSTLKNIMWCKCPYKWFRDPRQYRKDANGRLIKYSEYYDIKDLPNIKLFNTGSWVIDPVLIPKADFHQWGLDYYEPKISDKIFNMQAESIKTYEQFMNGVIYNSTYDPLNSEKKYIVYKYYNSSSFVIWAFLRDLKSDVKYGWLSIDI